MSDIELKACPFCGGPADQQNYVVEAVVHCTACCAVIRRVHARDVDTGIDSSASAWNTRAPQWQPIESAPNGQLALFCDMSATELRSSFFVDWVVEGKFCGNRHHTATHWQPLPAAPEVSA